MSQICSTTMPSCSYPVLLLFCHLVPLFCVLPLSYPVPTEPLLCYHCATSETAVPTCAVTLFCFCVTTVPLLATDVPKCSTLCSLIVLLLGYHCATTSNRCARLFHPCAATLRPTSVLPGTPVPQLATTEPPWSTPVQPPCVPLL
jgi:hypothetical protein